jgi:hypothetical protein
MNNGNNITKTQIAFCFNYKRDVSDTPGMYNILSTVLIE